MLNEYTVKVSHAAATAAVPKQKVSVQLVKEV